MADIKSICVYCASRDGSQPEYATVAREIGKIMAARGIRLIYGGASVGIMGQMARTMLAEGGQVVGVIPSQLDDREVTFEQCTELHVVGSMHDRKKMMFDLSDAFLVLPGGVGTLEEMVEVGTWRQLQLHEKPIVVLNQLGYWQPLIDLFKLMIEREFASDNLHEIFHFVEKLEDIMPAFDNADEPWLENDSRLF